MAICGLLDFRHIIASVFLPQRPHIEEPNIDPSPASNIPHTPVLSPEYMMPSSCRSFGPEPIRDQPPNTELEQQQQQQQAMSKPSTLSPASLPALAILVKGALAPLFKTTDPYLSPAYLENHRIKVRRLDFESGVTLDRAGRKADPIHTPKNTPRLSLPTKWKRLSAKPGLGSRPTTVLFEAWSGMSPLTTGGTRTLSKTTSLCT